MFLHAVGEAKELFLAGVVTDCTVGIQDTLSVGRAFSSAVGASGHKLLGRSNGFGHRGIGQKSGGER